MRSRSLKIYPRPDSEYKKKQSLDFQTVRSNIYDEKPRTMRVRLYSWVVYGILGLAMGLSAFLIEILVSFL